MKQRCDIAVVGSGAAGIAAAIGAARAGCDTVLIDSRPGPGGIGGFSGLTTLCGLYDEHGTSLNDGFTREFAEALGEGPPVKMGRVWVLLYRPERFRELAASLLEGCANLRLLWNTAVTRVEVEQQTIRALDDLEVKAVIDCTGVAHIALAAGAECFSTDASTQAPATVFALRGVARDLASPGSVPQVLLPVARAGWPTLAFHPSLEPSGVTVKFAGTPAQVPALLEFLRQQVSGFERCHAEAARIVQSSRAGRMVLGEYVLTGADVLAGRHFPDAAARCAWPIEQWNAQGVVRFRYLPAGEHYEVPARSLRAANLRNLFMAGKTISADADAIGSARVMGCCLATGAAAGNLAARYLQSARN
jgi:hypothetical protein